MKIILSRKGFDSSSGGCPSPILPDGRLVSLPIPDSKSRVSYADIRVRDIGIAQLVSQLSRGRQSPEQGAHLDPDLDARSLLRAPNWRPSLGQSGAAQGHLRNQGVGAGDLFLFFGLFRPVVPTHNGWAFDKHKPALHLLWGWMQIAETVPVGADTASRFPWLSYHPHLDRQDLNNNTLYIGADRLTLSGADSSLNGAGAFSHFNSALCLTEFGSERPGIWNLPAWFYPGTERPPLSYHANPVRWERLTGRTRLSAASRGQEFVLNGQHYPEAGQWARMLISDNTKESKQLK